MAGGRGQLPRVRQRQGLCLGWGCWVLVAVAYSILGTLALPQLLCSVAQPLSPRTGCSLPQPGGRPCRCWPTVCWWLHARLLFGASKVPPSHWNSSPSCANRLPLHMRWLLGRAVGCAGCAGCAGGSGRGGCATRRCSPQPGVARPNCARTFRYRIRRLPQKAPSADGDEHLAERLTSPSGSSESWHARRIVATAFGVAIAFGGHRMAHPCPLWKEISASCSPLPPAHIFDGRPSTIGRPQHR